MQIHLDELATQQITQCLDLLKDVLDQDLVSLYLYGSSIVGGLQKYSDVDLLAVSRRQTTLDEKAEIIHALLDISGVYLKSAKKPIELTLIVQSEVNPWHYPPKFDFQYGDWLRDPFEKGVLEPWDSKTMPDLALLLTQVCLARWVVYGAQPDQVLAPVPYLDFITASTDEIDSLLADLEPDTRNVLLTLARIWSTLETDAIRSKPAAAAWAIAKLPPEFQAVMMRARAICLGAENPGWDDMQALIKPCADFMVAKIKIQTEVIRSSDTTQRFIRMGE